MIYIVNHWISAVQLLDRTCVHVTVFYSYDCEILCNKTLVKYIHTRIYLVTNHPDIILKTDDVEGLVIL